MRNPNAKVTNPNDFFTEPGSPDKELFSAKVLPNGCIDVVPSGKECLQDKIESFRSQTDMAYILKQITLGNSDVLVRSVGQYGDFTEMPKSMAEAMQLQIDAEKEFYKLDLDTRSKFQNDFRQWLVSAGSPEWIKKMGIIQQVIKEDEKGEEVPDSIKE